MRLRHPESLVLVWVLMLGFASPSFGADTTIEIDLAGSRVQQHSARPGSVFLELSPLVPGAEYVVGDLPKFKVDAVPGDADATKDLCKEPAKNIWGTIKAAKNESDVASALQAATSKSSQCTFEERELVLGTINEIRTKLTNTVTLKGKITPPVTVEIKRDPEAWKVFVVQGPAGKPDLLNEIERRMDSDERSTVIECSYLHGRCETDPLFVNADHVSAIIIRGVPTNKTLRVVADSMSEPYKKCEILRQNSKSFKRDETPDVVVVTLNMFREVYGLGWLNRDRRRAAGLRLYGWSDDPNSISKEAIEKLCKTSDLTTDGGADDDSNERALQETERRVASSLSVPLKTVDVQRVILRAKGYQIEETSAIPILVDGKTEQVKITVFSEGEDPKTFVVPFFYQRWWVDAGGAFLFPYKKDERLVKETQSDGKIKVLDIKNEPESKPETGIVINLHPGNFPEMAFQFGLSTGSDSQLTYYFGPAIRLREIGKRGLATFSVGAALAPTLSYPELVKDLSYAAADARLLGNTSYEAHWYFGISLGFNFGGVAAGADAVKELP